MDCYRKTDACFSFDEVVKKAASSTQEFNFGSHEKGSARQGSCRCSARQGNCLDYLHRFSDIGHWTFDI